MTAAAVMHTLPTLERGRQVVAHYELRDCLGRRTGERHLAGTLVALERVSPTVFRARVRNYDRIEYVIDSRIGEVQPA